MELDNIENLLQKYAEGETNLQEEKELKDYFSGSNVAPNLESYIPVFSYFEKVKKQELVQEIPLPKRKKKRSISWTRIAASLIFIVGIVTFFVLTKPPKKEPSTIEDPEIAFKETQKALDLMSENLNIGIESVQYINEYEKTKKIIFKE